MILIPGPAGRLFAEIGPYFVDETLRLERNPYSWHKHAHLMFVDYPVGTGFSYTSDPSRYVRNDMQGADDFMTFLRGFYEQHPRYRSCDLYLTGESYAGKYIPAIAHRVINSTCGTVPRLGGIAICGAWTHPEAQVPHYSPDAARHGLLSTEQQRTADRMMHEVMCLMQKGEMLKATQLWDEAADFIYGSGGNFSPYDVRDFSGTADDPQDFDRWLALPEVRQALHAGDRVWNEDDGVAVFEALREDDMVSSLEYLQDVLMNNTRVLLFNGQYDWVTNYSGVKAMLEKHLQWDGREAYLTAEQLVWTVDGTVAGYVRKADLLTHVLVLGAGHMVPAGNAPFAPLGDVV